MSTHFRKFPCFAIFILINPPCSFCTCNQAMEIITKGALIVSIRERYDFNGSVSLCARRDKRSGQHRGKVCHISSLMIIVYLIEFQSLQFLFPMPATASFCVPSAPRALTAHCRSARLAKIAWSSRWSGMIPTAASSSRPSRCARSPALLSYGWLV